MNFCLKFEVTKLQKNFDRNIHWSTWQLRSILFYRKTTYGFNDIGWCFSKYFTWRLPGLFCHKQPLCKK